MDVGLTGGIAQVAAKIEVDGYVLLWYIVHAMMLLIRVILTDTIYIVPVKQNQSICFLVSAFHLSLHAVSNSYYASGP